MRPFPNSEAGQSSPNPRDAAPPPSATFSGLQRAQLHAPAPVESRRLSGSSTAAQGPDWRSNLRTAAQRVISLSPAPSRPSLCPLAVCPSPCFCPIIHCRCCLCSDPWSEMQLVTITVTSLTVAEIPLAGSAISGESRHLPAALTGSPALFYSVPVEPSLICTRPHQNQ